MVTKDEGGWGEEAWSKVAKAGEWICREDGAEEGEEAMVNDDEPEELGCVSTSRAPSTELS